MMKRLPGVALIAAAACAQAQAGPDLVAKLERLAERGDAEAAYHLGMAYQTGAGVARDPERALAQFRRAATGGSALGAYKLGRYYAGQHGVIAPDPEQALRHKLVAAEAGYALAQLDVAGVFARQGEMATAAAWLDKAAAQGDKRALLALANLHGGDHGAPRDPALSLAHLMLAASPADAPAELRAEFAKRERALGADERARMRAIIDGHAARPTPITLEARAGLRAAEALVARRR